MKVILIKDSKDGKENEIIDVKAGYATNFLIKGGYAIALNPKTKKQLMKKMKQIEINKQISIDHALKLKDKIEQLTLHFTLKSINNVIHGSITRKQIVKKLRAKDFHIDTTNIENIKIQSLGISNVKIKLHKEVEAILKVEVKEDE